MPKGESNGTVRGMLDFLRTAPEVVAGILFFASAVLLFAFSVQSGIIRDGLAERGRATNGRYGYTPESREHWRQGAGAGRNRGDARVCEDSDCPAHGGRRDEPIAITIARERRLPADFDSQAKAELTVAAVTYVEREYLIGQDNPYYYRIAVRPDSPTGRNGIADVEWYAGEQRVGVTFLRLGPQAGKVEARGFDPVRGLRD